MQYFGRRWIGVGALLVLVIVANLVEDRRVERDIRDRAEMVIAADRGVEEASAEVAGRDVMLVGISASSEAADALASKVAALPGVRLVRPSFVRPPEAHPYVFSVKREGEDLVLSGDVPSEEVRQKIVSEAAASAEHVIDHLAYASGAPVGDFARAAGAAMGAIAGLDSGVATIRDTEVTVGGDLYRADERDRIERDLRSALPAPFAVGPSRLVAPTVSPYVFKLEEGGGTVHLTGSAPDDGARKRIEAAVKAQFPKAVVKNDLHAGSGPPQGFVAAVTNAMPALARLGKGALTLSGDKALLTGEAHDPKTAEEVRSSLAAALGSGFSLHADIVQGPPPSEQATCQAKVSGILSGGGLNFAPGSDVLTQLATPSLDELVAVLGQCPSARIALIPLYRPAETADRDPSLTLRRTKATVARLAAAGVDTSRIDTDESLRTGAVSAKGTPGSQGEKLPTVAPYPFTLEIGEGTVHLAGDAPDNDARRRIEGATRKQFFDAVVRNDLKLAAGAPKDFAVAVTSALPALARLGKGTLTLSGGTADVSGEAAFPRASEEVKQALASALGSAFAVHSDISVGVPLQLDAAACQPSFAHLLDTGHIEFTIDSAALPDDATPLLDRLVSIAMRCRSAEISVSGYTDATGTEEHNLVLSRRRAQSVVAYLAAAGVDIARIKARGYGEDAPVASNATPSGRAENRHIEFKVVK